MNKLFKKNQVVRLADCDTYDKRYGLSRGTTMGLVARKMQGGEPNNELVKIKGSEELIGFNVNGDVGTWNELRGCVRSTVEGVLYASENGLTLDELSNIPGAFEKGKEYVCAHATNESELIQGNTYKADGNGIVVPRRTISIGKIAKLKPLFLSQLYKPEVGEKCYVTYPSGNHDCEIVAYHSDMVMFLGMGLYRTLQLSQCEFKPIDHERERVINSCCDTLGDQCPRNVIECLVTTLYDAGRLK